MMWSAPIVPAYVTRAEPGRTAQAVLWCEHCGCIHTHSASPGHRAAHCFWKESPYTATGYILDIRGEVTSPEDVVPKALFAGQRHLGSDLAGATAGAIRTVLLQHLIGTRAGNCVSKRFGRARVTVYGNTWSIEPDAYLSSSELSSGKWHQSPRLEGQGFPALLAALYGISDGVAAVDLFAATSGTQLDAQARTEMAAVIKAAYARKTAGRNGLS